MEVVISFTLLPLFLQGNSPTTPCIGAWVSPRAVWTLWRTKNILAVSEIKPRSLGHPAHSLISTPTELSAILCTQDINRNYNSVKMWTPLPNIVGIRPVFSDTKHEDRWIGQFFSVGNIFNLILEVPASNLWGFSWILSAPLLQMHYSVILPFDATLSRYLQRRKISNKKLGGE
jgi:hypothetical protein